LPAETQATLDTDQAAQLRHARKRPGLSPADLALMLKMSQEGQTQATIGRRFGVDQSYISKVLAEFHDTTDLSKSFLRGSALKMARNIVKNGRAADHVAALKGLSVLADEQHSSVTVIVGGSGQVNIGVALSPISELSQGETLQIPQQNLLESDK
jgi:hypothetical protein